MKTLLIILFGILILILAFFSYQENRRNIFEEKNTIQTGYGISGVGATGIQKDNDPKFKNCIKVWSQALQKYTWKCR